MNSGITLVLSALCSMIIAAPVPTLNNAVAHAAPKKVVVAPTVKLNKATLPRIHDYEPGLSYWSSPELVGRIHDYEPGLSYWSSPEPVGKQIQDKPVGSDDSFAMIEKSLSSEDLKSIDDFFNFEKDLDYGGLSIGESGSWDDIWNSPSIDDESNWKMLHFGDSSRPLDAHLNSEYNGVASGSKRPAEHTSTGPRPPKKYRVKKEPVATVSQGELDFNHIQIQRNVRTMDRAGFEMTLKQVLPPNIDIFDSNLNKVLDMFATKPQNLEGKMVNLPLVKDGPILNAIKTLPNSQKQIALAYAGSQARWRLANQLLKSGINRVYLDHIMAVMRHYH